MAGPLRPVLTFIALALELAVTAAPGEAQFDEVVVPQEMQALDFMLGEWVVRGTFRTPDHIGSDRTLWYTTLGGGLTRFDGRSWTAFVPGASATADSIQSLVTERAATYAFSHPLRAHWAQDGFLLVIDQGRTSGTSVVYYDTPTSQWVGTQFHAATNSVSTTRAQSGQGGPPVFAGRGTDRRGERISRTSYELHDADHFTIRTDISFDEGVTWIDDQIVHEVTRR